MNKQIQLAITLAVLAIAGVAGADDSATVKVFQDKCATCHGADGKARTPMGKQLNIKDWNDGKTLNSLSDADISKEIKVGKALMPGYPELSVDQLKALVDYVRTFQR